MNNKDITAALAALNESMYLLEEEYIDNGGEVTEQTEQMEARIESLKALLKTEGVDSLGRWLKTKEDLVKTLKAEKASVDRQIKAVENTIDFIKFQIGQVLSSIGEEKVKGTFYTFAPAISRKTEVDKEILEDKYIGKVAMVLDEILPAWVSVKLSASVKAIPEGVELPSEFKVIETLTCKFTKPRGKKEDTSWESE